MFGQNTQRYTNQHKFANNTTADLQLRKKRNYSGSASRDFPSNRRH